MIPPGKRPFRLLRDSEWGRDLPALNHRNRCYPAKKDLPLRFGMDLGMRIAR